MYRGNKGSGFTIVELLIVIVVIGILAAITIVAFNGVSNRAKVAALQNTVSQLSKKLESAKTLDSLELYPSSLSAANITVPSGVSYSINTTGTGYCLVAVDGTNSYYSTHFLKKATPGSCVTADGLLAWWPLNGSADDVSGNSIASTPVNVVPTTGQNGQANGAYAFNGTNSQVNCGTPAFLRVTAAASVSLWVNMTAYTALNGFFNYGGGGYWLTADSTGLPSYYITSTNLTGPSVLGLNQWYLVTGTFTSGERKLYINGNQVAADTGGGAATINNYASDCQIGSVKSVGGRFMNGKMDDVRIYNRVLTAAEVQSLYSAGAQ